MSRAKGVSILFVTQNCGKERCICFAKCVYPTADNHQKMKKKITRNSLTGSWCPAARTAAALIVTEGCCNLIQQ